MKRAPKLTKKERKALNPNRPTSGAQQAHIHCIACGRHLDPQEFNAPATATMIRCEHGSRFPSCSEHEDRSRELVAEHDRTGRGIQAAAAWH